MYTLRIDTEPFPVLAIGRLDDASKVIRNFVLIILFFYILTNVFVETKHFSQVFFFKNAIYLTFI